MSKKQGKFKELLRDLRNNDLTSCPQSKLEYYNRELSRRPSNVKFSPEEEAEFDEFLFQVEMLLDEKRELDIS